MAGRASGFSLPELLAVVLVLGIAASIAVPTIMGADPEKLRVAAEEIAQAMRFARSEAIRTGEPHGFRLHSADQRIRVFRVDTGTAPWTPLYDIYHPISKKLYDVDLSTHRLARVDILTHDRLYRGACDSPRNVYFDGSGIPRCTDPETVLLERFQSTMTLDGHTRIVTLDGVTGRVTVE